MAVYCNESSPQDFFLEGASAICRQAEAEVSMYGAELLATRKCDPIFYSRADTLKN